MKLFSWCKTLSVKLKKKRLEILRSQANIKWFEYRQHNVSVEYDQEYCPSQETMPSGWIYYGLLNDGTALVKCENFYAVLLFRQNHIGLPHRTFLDIAEYYINNNVHAIENRYAMAKILLPYYDLEDPDENVTAFMVGMGQLPSRLPKAIQDM